MRPIYDPRFRIIKDFKDKCKHDKVPFDESKLNDLLEQHEKRERQKRSGERNYYQNIMKSGHNPYDESNYAIYGDTLNVDMSDKANLEIAESKD